MVFENGKDVDIWKALIFNLRELSILKQWAGNVLVLPRDFSMKGPWEGSTFFLLYVLVTRSTSGCLRVISSINVC